MPSASEALGAQSQMQAVLDAGVDSISVKTNVVFTLYQKYTFSQDGYVFWVATSTTISITGALHYASDRVQNEDETIAQNQVLLTAEQEVTEFNNVAPNTMWIGTWPLAGSSVGTESDQSIGTEGGEGIGVDGSSGLALQVAFGRRGFYFGPANLWHYSGFAVYPALSAQLVASEADLPTGPIVSNSLPIWLALNAIAPVYASFLVPDNIVPPYVVAHVDPGATQALQAFPILVWPGTVVPDSGASPLYDLPSSQLMRDEVELTLYGFTNLMAIQYLASLIDASMNAATFGFANSPAIRDAKRVQVEIAALAQKKTIHVSANYYQSCADAIARRLILQASLSSVTTQSPPA